jgi:hypothetical protein
MRIAYSLAQANQAREPDANVLNLTVRSDLKQRLRASIPAIRPNLLMPKAKDLDVELHLAEA